MGGGGKTKSKSTSYSGSSNPAFQPYALQGVGNVNQVYSQAQPGLQGLTNLTQNTLVPSLTSKFQGGMAGANAAQGYNESVLRGDYMAGNPHVNAIWERLRSDVGDDVNGTFARSGRYGSGAHQDVLAGSLANAGNNLFYQNYMNEMARRDAAANSLTGANQQDLNQLLGTIGIGAELPYTGSNNLANSLGALFSGGTETTKSKSGGGGLLGGLLGGAAQIGSAAIMASDRRLKKNIVEVGTLPNGLTVYDFTYRNDPERATYRGVMADQVKELVPAAYVENFDGKGHDGVNYALVGMPLLKLAA